jgi:hypothetical protein
MAKINLNTLKSKFESGDKPNGQDYLDLIDTLAAQATDLGSDGNNENTIYGIENYTVLETIDATSWRSVKYVVSISHTVGGENKYYTTEISALIDDEGLSISEYAVLDNDGDIGTISVSRNGSNLELVVTPLPNIRPITVRYARMGLRS